MKKTLLLPFGSVVLDVFVSPGRGRAAVGESCVSMNTAEIISIR